MLPELLSDYARRAAEAFIEASRCEDTVRAAQLRHEAYKLVDLIREREDLLRDQRKG